MKKASRIISTIALVIVILTLSIPAVVSADNLIPDGDGITPIGSNSLALGDITQGSSASGDVLLAINRVGGGGNTFANSATVTVSVDSVSMSSVSATMDDDQIALPADWVSLSNNVLSSDTASSTVTVDTTGQTLGSHSATVHYSASGNKNGGGTVDRPGNLEVTWTVVEAPTAPADTTAPAITAPDDITVEGNTTGGATGVDLGSPAVSDDVDPSPDVTNDAPAFFPLGPTTVTWTATDASGNAASDTQTVTVVDTTAPSITAPDDITVEGNTVGGANVALVDLGSATASDDVDPTPTITNDFVAGFYVLGSTTTVTWTATDDSGNSATDTQTVTVVDTTAPSITAVASLTVIVGTPSSVLSAPTVSDIVDPSPVVTNNAPAFFPLGTTTVIWTATDASGNSATATTTVTAIYSFGRFLPPLGPGPSAFKAGSTIPVKFQLTDYDGNPVSTASGTADINTSPTASAAIRYDATAMQYIANLKTPKGAAPGTYTITVTLDDGQQYSKTITIK